MDSKAWLARTSALTAVLALTGSVGAGIQAGTAAAASVPRPAHVVVVLMENHAYGQIIGSASAPYLNSLARAGASFTNAHGVTHPSQPNYLALFSGSAQGVTSDSCPHTFASGDLASELIAAKLSFKGYAETLPATGSKVCTSGAYARKHAPWTNFTNVPATDSPGSFPTSYSSLPTVSFVVPNLQHDMHDGTVAQGDAWLKAHIGPYVTWAKTHNSLLVVTWDEDDNTKANVIPTIFVGPMVKAGKYSESTNHYRTLRTIEDAYGLKHLGASASVAPVTDIW